MSQRAPSETGIQLTAENLRALVETAQDLFALLAPDGTLLYANAAFSRVLGHSTDELIGTRIVELMHPSEADRARSTLKTLSSELGATRRDRCRLRCKDGSWRKFETTGRNFLTQPGVEAIAATFRDVTDRSRMESERQVISDVIHALNQTNNLDELLVRIHQALKKVLYAENCFIVLHDPEAGTFDFPFFVDRFDPPPPPLKVDRSCTAYVFRTGRAMLIPQSEFDLLVEKGEVELVGSPSPAWLGAPLKTPTATIGVLVVQHYENENAYDNRDLEFLDSVGGTIALAIERRRSEDFLRKSEAIFRSLFSNNPLPTWLLDRESRHFLQVNRAAIEQYGYSEEEFLGMRASTVEAEEERTSTAPAAPASGLRKHRRKDGKIISVEMSSHDLEFGGRPALLVVARDTTEHRLLEEQLRQAQKMEAVGRLAGGVAHDFNNLLMVIKGHTELLLASPEASEKASRKIQQIDRAADRAASLTRQLLAFSRMQVLQPRVMNINEIVEEMGKLLPRLIGEDVELVIRTEPELGRIRADASQMEQIIMNLAVNSRDAMPTGGRLIIETSNVDLDEAYSTKHPVVQPGRFVVLAVTDTGTGMDAETQAHIFEPFYTTKEQGKGTGLGLATVYGVVKQSGGFIWVYSEVGKGTCFKIYLPRVDQMAEKSVQGQSFAEIPRGTETVLLAEDEQDVREVAREFLESAGYTVIEACNGNDAIRLAQEHAGTIDLLVTDMVMPGMTGKELASRLKEMHAVSRVVYMSGYTEQASIESNQAEESSSRLLTKPFSRAAILRTARELLSDPVA